MNNSTTTVSQGWDQRSTAGFGLLAMAIIAGWSYGVAIDGQIVDGDAEATATNISSAANMFRLGATGLLIVAILDVLVAWALYGVFRSKHQGLALLGAWCRLAYAAWFAMAINDLFGALRAAPVDPAQTMFLLETFEEGWQAGLILFGLHLAITGWLLWRPGLFERITSVLLFIAALGYALDGFSMLLSPNGSWDIAVYTFIGEIVLIVWLLAKGGKEAVTSGSTQAVRSDADSEGAS